MSSVVRVKDKEAFNEVSEKMIHLRRQYNQVTQRAQFRAKDKRHIEVTMAELEACPADTRMYQGIGKAFIIEEAPVIKKQLLDRQAVVEKEVKTAQSTAQYLEKSLKEVESTLKDLIIAPEVGAPPKQ